MVGGFVFLLTFFMIACVGVYLDWLDTHEATINQHEGRQGLGTGWALSVRIAFRHRDAAHIGNSVLLLGRRSRLVEKSKVMRCWYEDSRRLL